jgi:hypothetical protein
MDQKAITPDITRRPQKKHKSCYQSTSNILRDITNINGETITVHEILRQLGDRGFGMILLLFALPNTIPIPIPVISTITSLPLIFFAAQLALGKERIWLPNWLSKKKIPLITLRLMVHKSLPWLTRLEKLIKPRLDKVTTQFFERFAGMLIFVLAVLIALPIPLGNWPLGVAMVVLSLAITERDGLIAITGWLLTILALCYLTVLISGYAWIIGQLVSRLF